MDGGATRAVDVQRVAQGCVDCDHAEIDVLHFLTEEVRTVTNGIGGPRIAASAWPIACPARSR